MNQLILMFMTQMNLPKSGARMVSQNSKEMAIIFTETNLTKILRGPFSARVSKIRTVKTRTEIKR